MDIIYILDICDIQIFLVRCSGFKAWNLECPEEDDEIIYAMALGQGRYEHVYYASSRRIRSIEDKNTRVKIICCHL